MFKQQRPVGHSRCCQAKPIKDRQVSIQRDKLDQHLSAEMHMAIASTLQHKIVEGSLEAKLPTVWRDRKGTARK